MGRCGRRMRVAASCGVWHRVRTTSHLVGGIDGRRILAAASIQQTERTKVVDPAARLIRVRVKDRDDLFNVRRAEVGIDAPHRVDRGAGVALPAELHIDPGELA